MKRLFYFFLGILTTTGALTHDYFLFAGVGAMLILCLIRKDTTLGVWWVLGMLLTATILGLPLLIGILRGFFAFNWV